MTSLRPTRRGVALLVTALVALLVAGRYTLPALLPVTGFLLGLVVLGLVAATVVPRRLSLQRTITPRVLDHGGTATATLRVSTRSAVDAGDLTWRALLPEGLGGPLSGPVGRPAESRSRTGPVEVAFRVTGSTRGHHDVGPLVVDSCDPFGVAVRRRCLEDPIEVVVLPRRVPLPRLSTLHGHEVAPDGRPTARRRGHGEDDVVSRQYQPGDAPKRIDWRTTARRGELMVRQDEPTTTEQITVAIDPGTEPDATEWALVAGASAIAHLVDDGHVTSTVVPGCESRTVSGVHDSLREALIDLAGLTHHDRSPVGAPPVVGGPVVAVLGVVDVARAREWATDLRRASTVRALVAGESGEAAVQVLRAAGWRVVVWDTVDAVPARWSELGREVTRAPA